MKDWENDMISNFLLFDVAAKSMFLIFQPHTCLARTGSLIQSANRQFTLTLRLLSARTRPFMRTMLPDLGGAGGIYPPAGGTNS